jgi:hypothetical protein
MALAAGRGAGLDLGRTVRDQHEAQGGQPAALTRVGRVQETLVVAAALRPVGDLKVYGTESLTLQIVRTCRTRQTETP